MSNRTFLLASGRSQLSSKGYDAADIMVAASYCVPLLWLALFDISNIRTRKAKLEDGESAEVPYLSARSKEALQRFRTRRSTLVKIVNQYESLLSDFEVLLTAAGGENFIVDLEELWSMDQDRFSAQLSSAIASFEQNSSELFQTVGPIVGISSVEGDLLVRSESVRAHLVGYGWEMPVPWEDRAAFDDCVKRVEAASSIDKISLVYRKDSPPSPQVIVGLFDFYQLSVGWVSPDGQWSAPSMVPSQMKDWALQSKSRFKKMPRGLVFSSVERKDDSWLISTARTDFQDATLWQAWLKIIEGLQK